MNKKEFAEVRHRLARTQTEMANLLGISPKAIQSFEQGWRKIPVHVERQILFLLAKQRSKGKKNLPCWEIKKCLPSIRQECPAWEFQSGDLCWFINGTICQSVVHQSWAKKMKTCRRCEVFQHTLPYL